MQVSADSIRIQDTACCKYAYPEYWKTKYPESIQVSMRHSGIRVRRIRVSRITGTLSVMLWGVVIPLSAALFFRWYEV